MITPRKWILSKINNSVKSNINMWQLLLIAYRTANLFLPSTQFSAFPPSIAHV